MNSNTYYIKNCTATITSCQANPSEEYLGLSVLYIDNVNASVWNWNGSLSTELHYLVVVFQSIPSTFSHDNNNLKLTSVENIGNNTGKTRTTNVGMDCDVTVSRGKPYDDGVGNASPHTNTGCTSEP